MFLNITTHFLQHSKKCSQNLFLASFIVLTLLQHALNSSREENKAGEG